MKKIYEDFQNIKKFDPLMCLYITVYKPSNAEAKRFYYLSDGISTSIEKFREDYKKQFKKECPFDNMLPGFTVYTDMMSFKEKLYEVQ